MVETSVLFLQGKFHIVNAVSYFQGIILPQVIHTCLNIMWCIVRPYEL